ncbi:4-alpha-glucanotransferase [Dysgonomonas sp. PFB1-18]|uniref:4-alpha-glucanotransferase n=1 Tax=unclassified Dysgonomonas TaxID=2630389 RepID=UPI0024770A9E|nr:MULTISPECIES: 4-alpha-glucanotransferase [unclassified Dysgonomonas]MDH6307894.1 4-alpha-glucanotransferase [Dysgonomonas sp. PF1-14]MDH6337812.1 4-alpha-glucanotransferase [Dysgonomonas sp. PF1-16]MDH6379036.1 4-alpha-glucanotransferase [Dysgonomonas sp. PFB1-18]MDH6396671.1 4-alpha-glucanotransferase [Dysgonomonas sp. PF1-23]
MKLKLHIDYHAIWGQTLCVCGSAAVLGKWDEGKALEMICISPNEWIIEIDTEETFLEYRYLVKENNMVVAREWGNPHTMQLGQGKKFDMRDIWYGLPQQKFLHTSGFSESFFYHPVNRDLTYFKRTILLKVNCPQVKKGQTLILSGASATLGDWNIEKALRFEPVAYGEWQLTLNATSVKAPLEYKLAIYDDAEKNVVHWEIGYNRILNPVAEKGDIVRGESIQYDYGWMNWKAAGVAIPVFSLRSNDSFGVGEFSDIKKLVDWAAVTNQKIIQVLPINDTTITHTWLDSYPYNAISIYALHPIYLGLKDYPLKDKAKYKKYEAEAKALNALTELDYEKVLALKWAYLKDLFEESGAETLKSEEYLSFYKQNEEWLFPYACFCYFRDKYSTADFSVWKTYSTYDKKKLKAFVDSNNDAKQAVELACFIQYLSHKQLVGVKEYAHRHSVILKGDIPIGISRNSVEAWVEPHLFNLDVQTGAPPDDFSFYGQNWGFPTYNWEEMAKDGYQWWVKRFRKMADYFDAYRIDHILGFFRIWEIPLSSVQGLLGYFSPALPMSEDEIRSWGMWFDDYRMTSPYIHEHFLGDIFGEYTEEVIANYLNPIAWQRFELKEFCNTQVKIKGLFSGQTDEKSLRMRDGLYSLCNEVLFIRDKREPDKLHPRITAQFSYSYKDLDDAAKTAFNRLYDEFFYRRHSQYWRDQAMTKLPSLISSTSMLVCGEDLGMVPESVPSVMHELQILSLEIERMPKVRDMLFNYLGNLPYMSVCTTSTHDMAPIRSWWRENRELTQQYYNYVLWRNGAAPEDCDSDLCWQIVSNHLNSQSMLTILPLQDWLSVDDNLKRADAEEERINIPAIAQHYWRYRMHLSLEELIKADTFNARIRSIVESSGRK